MGEMEQVKSFRDLVAWQRAMDLVAMVYETSRGWPRDEAFGLTSQIRRAVVSVVANIAEGQGRSGSREFAHHLSIADGSLSEVEALVLVSVRLRFVDNETEAHLIHQVNAVRRPLRGLMTRLR
jgi:four helix bundle protein